MNDDQQEENRLVVKGFRRPLQLAVVKELFTKIGVVKEFSMDKIRSTAFVTYSSADEAKAAAVEIDGLLFQEYNEPLRVITSKKDTDDLVHEIAENPLDSLFSKTKAEPPIYYALKRKLTH